MGQVGLDVVLVDLQGRWVKAQHEPDPLETTQIFYNRVDPNPAYLIQFLIKLMENFKKYIKFLTHFQIGTLRFEYF